MEYYYKSGDKAMYGSEEVTVVETISPILIKIQGMFGRSHTWRWYYKNKWNRFWGIRSTRLVETKYLMDKNVSIWNLTPIN